MDLWLLRIEVTYSVALLLGAVTMDAIRCDLTLLKRHTEVLTAYFRRGEDQDLLALLPTFELAPTVIATMASLTEQLNHTLDAVTFAGWVLL